MDILIMKTDFIEIDPKTFQGTVPKGYDLIIAEKDDKTFENAMVLYGFDEVGAFDKLYNNPIYGFLKLG